MNFDLTYKPFGASAILIEWPSKIDEDIIQDIINFEKIIPKTPLILDTIIAYNSLTILYKELNFYENTVLQIKELYQSNRVSEKKDQKLWIIPVCYDELFGLDLEEIAKKKNSSIKEIIELHSTTIYSVYFIGFLPGFLYLGGLVPELYTPRKSTPRLRINQGSVGIGGKQTGIYPSNSSGGWNILGKSPVNFFNINITPSCFANPGDKIQFQKITIDTFYKIEKQIADGKYQLKSELL